ncbi:NACHT, LRR and PYD domains-containing protein 3-like isoform X2 [Stylophora pistillata]|uniref:NACHT, LRR and PYD domains-containing protein 3-like isoform X2 n=1 Tax=Stylophora pistillata TaxID=50429 RepID=UPI000C03DC74|nr:NACHT, LRR and PYD domains-containing protein 3-like isoform X2 [Stylophora pistillata]
MGAKTNELIYLIWKSQTYFGQLQVGVWSRSRTIFIGDANQQTEHLDNGCWCECVMPTDRQFGFFRLYLSEVSEHRELSCVCVNPLRKYLVDMRNIYSTKTEYIDHSPLDDVDNLKLDDMFTRPVLSGVKCSKTMAKKYSVEKKSTSLEGIGNISITGKAGMGKTTLAQKIARNWAKEKTSLSSQIKILLCLDFKALEDSPGEGISFEDLIRRQVSLDPPEDLLDFVKSNPNATLIVVDNVCKPNSGCQESDFRDSFEEKMPFSALLKKLVTGKILNGATVLILSRLTDNSVADFFGVASQTELMGFSPSEIKGYIEKYFTSSDDCEDDELATAKLKDNLTDNTLSICCVPLHCLYMCTLMKWLRRSDHAIVSETAGNPPETITELYIGIAQMISCLQQTTREPISLSAMEIHTPSLQNNAVEPPAEDSRSPLQNATSPTQSPRFSSWGPTQRKTSSKTQFALHHLAEIDAEVCSLAMKSIDEDMTVFDVDYLRSHMLSEEAISKYFKRTRQSDDSEKVQFTFRCDDLREFLAAYFVVLDRSFKRLKRLVEQVKNEGSRKQDRVLQFAYGLQFSDSQASDKNKKEMIDLVKGLYSVSPTEDIKRQKELQLVMIKCAAEIKDEKISREVASKMIPIVEFSGCEIGVAECSALANVLGTSPFASISAVDLSDNKISVMGARQLTQKLLLPGKGPTKELNVQGNVLGDEGLQELTEALKKRECRLKTLNVADNYISSDGISKLSSALESNTCLEELNLSCNQICSQGVEHLSNVLQVEKGKISKLNLSWNDIGDDGVTRLVSFKQSTLNLAWNNIGMRGVHSLISIFHTLNNLQELDLSGNNIESVGIEALLPCFMDANCKIRCLELNHCQIQDEGVIHCLKILNCLQNQITRLGLAGNNITNAGVEKIAEALTSLECRVTILNLSSNLIGDSGVESLSKSLSSPNCGLQELDLSHNQIQCKGCKCLAEAIRKPNCLECLNLEGNHIGNEGTAKLLSALRIHNNKLHTLVLVANDIGDEGIAGLPHTFRSPHCKLGRLDLGRNIISRTSIATVSEALKSPFCHLEHLRLKDSRLNESFEAKESVRATKLTDTV